ncbi:MAG: homocysteine S-methyltransferase, partial [Phycisphaeraceae bacterium]|nr:homocysteine S-methyltransferase [Phycisphaeraceae bacterium]
VQAHLQYLQAGANCLITASYQASELSFSGAGIGKDGSQGLILKSVELAQSAINEYMTNSDANQIRPFVAASVGPYGASLADGSEYHGNYRVTDGTLVSFHRDKLLLLDGSDADVLACETLPSFQEAKILKQLLASLVTPAWVSFSCKDSSHLNDGTTIEEAAMLFAGHDTVVAVGVNCTGPQFICGLIKRIKPVVPGKAIIVYPNSGETFDPDNKTWHGTSSPVECGSAAKQWIKTGATIVGGCCRMGPEHIRVMKENCDL